MSSHPCLLIFFHLHCFQTIPHFFCHLLSHPPYGSIHPLKYHGVTSAYLFSFIRNTVHVWNHHQMVSTIAASYSPSRDTNLHLQRVVCLSNTASKLCTAHKPYYSQDKNSIIPCFLSLSQWPSFLLQWSTRICFSRSLVDNTSDKYTHRHVPSHTHKPRYAYKRMDNER